MVRRLLQLYVGLGLYGLSTAMFIRSDLGVDPWDVFHLGVGIQLGMTIGTVIIVTGAAVLLLWIPLRQMPGLGTISNDSLPVRIAFLVSGIVMNAIATSMYIGAGFGPGPRDGLMTGIHARLGWSIRSVRTSIEVTVLLIGCVLGGSFGVGTVLYALTIGPLIQLCLPWFRQKPRIAEIARPERVV